MPREVSARERETSIGSRAIPVLLFHALCVVLLVAAILWLSSGLGETHHERKTAEPYESGVAPAGGASAPIRPGYHRIALLFVIFDVEVVFLFVWALVARDVGWTGYLGLLGFVLLLAVGFAYEWATGGLSWTRTRPRPRAVDSNDGRR